MYLPCQHICCQVSFQSCHWCAECTSFGNVVTLYNPGVKQAIIVIVRGTPFTFLNYFTSIYHQRSCLSEVSAWTSTCVCVSFLFPSPLQPTPLPHPPYCLPPLFPHYCTYCTYFLSYKSFFLPSVSPSPTPSFFPPSPLFPLSSPTTLFFFSPSLSQLIPFIFLIFLVFSITLLQSDKRTHWVAINFLFLNSFILASGISE